MKIIFQIYIIKNLGNNGIENIINYKNIKELKVSSNKLTNIDILEKVQFEKLEILNISHNKISDINLLM